QPHHLAYRDVLDRPPLGSRDSPLRKIVPSLEQRRRPQQTAYMIGAKRRPCSSWHVSLTLGSGPYYSTTIVPPVLSFNFPAAETVGIWMQTVSHAENFFSNTIGLSKN